MRLNTVMASILSMVMLFGLTFMPAMAHDDDDRYRRSSVGKTALIGAGIGAAVGGLTSEPPLRTRGMVKGALIGGAGGAAVGYLKDSNRYNSRRDRRHWNRRHRRGW